MSPSLCHSIENPLSKRALFLAFSSFSFSSSRFFWATRISSYDTCRRGCASSLLRSCHQERRVSGKWEPRTKQGRTDHFTEQHHVLPSYQENAPGNVPVAVIHKDPLNRVLQHKVGFKKKNGKL